MIDLSVKGLVQFMTGDDAQRRRVLAAFKFPDIGKPLRTYYREAIPTIRSCVAGEITRVQCSTARTQSRKKRPEPRVVVAHGSTITRERSSSTTRSSATEDSGA